jgi:hypothetical protein
VDREGDDGDEIEAGVGQVESGHGLLPTRVQQVAQRASRRAVGRDQRAQALVAHAVSDRVQ